MQNLNFGKPLRELTDDELQNGINNWSPQFGALALNEIQRRLQKVGSEQISSLLRETEKLKDIAQQNSESATKEARSNRKLAVVAIFISVIAVLVQVILDIERKDRCADFGNDIRCTTWFEAGLFGTWVIPERSISK